MESGSGFSMFSSLAGDFQLTTFPKTLMEEAKKNPWKTVKEFQSVAIDNIFPLLMISVFGPARGSEYARATWSNTKILSRSLFKDGMLTLAVTKTSISQKKPNTTVRLIPTPILKLIIYYIYIVRQIEKVLLNVGGVQITTKLERRDEEQREQEVDDYIDDIDKDKDLYSPLTNPTIGDMLDTYIFLYGDTILSSTKRTATIRDFISRNIPFKGKHHVSGTTGRVLRHVLIHYNRLIITKDSQTHSLIQFMDPIELSANHSVQTGLSTYAKTGKVNYVITALANSWERFLFETPQALVDQLAVKYHVDDSINTKDSYQLLAVGKMLYGKSFEYRNDTQCSITETSYFTNQSILVNLKTGFGKTITSLLPAAADALHFKHRHNPNHPGVKRTTVILVPFVALLQQYEELLATKFRDVLTFVKHSPSEDMNPDTLISHDIVLLQLEHCRDDVLLSFMDRFAKPTMAVDGNFHVISRIVVDEAHVLL
ncbi:DEAD/DEAH box helicase family protein CYBJADRAFT_175944, partial [Cyberlindnera jadinii NRRL Y-1542]